jgi:lysyl-tRNA synthetase class I
VAVYVDDMHTTKMGEFGRMKMCHMIADSSEELLAMADRIGVARKWLQHAGTPSEHFDIAQAKRAMALQNGAKAITMRELGRKLMERRQAAAAARLTAAPS